MVNIRTIYINIKVKVFPYTFVRKGVPVRVREAKHKVPTIFNVVNDLQRNSTRTNVRKIGKTQ